MSMHRKKVRFLPSQVKQLGMNDYGIVLIIIAYVRGSIAGNKQQSAFNWRTSFEVKQLRG